MKLITATEVNEEARYLRLMVYGEPGSGKTWFGASAALDDLTAPVLFCEYRSQITSVRSNPEYLKAIEDGRLIIVRLEQYNELSAVYSWLSRGAGSSKGLDDMMTNVGREGQMPKTVVIDSLTELQRTEVMRRAGNVEGKFIRDVASPQIQDWGSLLNQFTLLAHLFFQLPYHIVFGGLEDVDYGNAPVGESPPITGYRVALQGQAKRQFPAYALVVMRLERAARNLNAHNVGYTQAVKSKTKDQTGQLPEKIIGPTIPMLVKMLG